MAKLTTHAKERLTERFEIEMNEINVSSISNKFNTSKFFKLISKNKDQEIREIIHDGKFIQGIIKHDWIVTVTEATMIQEYQALDLQKLRVNYEKLYADLSGCKVTIKELNKTISIMKNKSFYKAFILLLSFRINNREN